MLITSGIFIILSVILTIYGIYKTGESINLPHFISSIAYIFLLIGAVLGFKYTEEATFKQALIENPYEMKIDKTYRDGELIKQDTVYTLKDK